MSINYFREFWKSNNGNEIFEKKSALTRDEIFAVQSKIAELQSKGYPSSKIISALQEFNFKLTERWRAERAYWTEVKVDDTGIVGEAGDELGISSYKAILSPNPCPICLKKTDRGSKVFKNQDLEKSGYGHVPPFHPNCYCILVPTE